jgi:Pyridoxamine 5'-phosphate oxidase
MEDTTVPKQGDLSLLEHPVAQELLGSRHLAKLAYVGTDGEPRVVPIWFHWDGREVVMGGPPAAPKMRALGPMARVAISIDRDIEPYHVLMIRGTARTEIVDGVPSEYRASATRYMGEEAGAGWVGTVEKLFPRMARIAVRPEWVGVIDFETRFPIEIEKSMAAAGAGAH